MGVATTVTRAGCDDWRAVRAVRLRALADTPSAFASSLAREETFDEREWRRRLVDGAWFLARDGDRVAGLAVGIGEDAVPDARMLVSMWVEPAERGRPTAAVLVDAVGAWARDEGALTLTAWVVDGNSRARRFYARRGFRADGVRQPLPDRPDVHESRLRLAL